MDFNIKKFKLDTLQILTVLFIVLFLVYNYWRLPYGLDTLWDEGFLLMNYQIPYLQGITQSHSIISKIFGNSIHDILFLRKSRYFVQLFTILLFSVASVLWIINKFSKITQNRLISYFLIIMLFGIGSIDIMNSSIISYNHLQQTCILFAISALLFFDIFHKVWVQYFCLIIVGFFLLFAFLNIPPSGLVVGLIVVLILIFYKKQNFSKFLCNILFLFFGIFLAISIYHVYFVNIFTLIKEMLITAKISVKDNANHGHNFYNFLYLTIDYLKFYLYRIILFALLCFMYFYFEKKKGLRVLLLIIFFLLFYIEPGYYNIIYPLVFVVSYILYSIFKKNNGIHIKFDFIVLFASFGAIVFSIYAFVFKTNVFPIWGYVIIPFALLYILHYGLKNKIKINRYLVIPIALFILPLSATIGTNTPLLTKSIYFLSFWGIFLVYLLEMIYKKYNVLFIKVSIIIVILIITFSFFQNHRNIKDTYGNECTSNIKYENLHTIKNIYIRPEQKEYFERVNSILVKYNFKKGDSFFCCTKDNMTMFAFEASSATKLYLNWKDFVEDPIKHVNIKPKFLFFYKWEVQKLNDTLKKMNWGFPEEYDEYYIGTSESIKTFYSTERWLYCKKTSNIINK